MALDGDNVGSGGDLLLVVAKVWPVLVAEVAQSARNSQVTTHATQLHIATGLLQGAHESHNFHRQVSD